MSKKDFLLPVSIRSEQELYSEFDPSGQVLSSSLRDYLSDYIEDRNIGEDVHLVLSSSEEPDMERFRKAYSSFLDRLIERNRKEANRFKIDSVRLLITGIIFVAAGILLSGLINQVLAVIISTIGSFSIWEASAVWIKTLPNLRAKRLLMKKLASAKIHFEKTDP